MLKHPVYISVAEQLPPSAAASGGLHTGCAAGRAQEHSGARAGP